MLKKSKTVAQALSVARLKLVETGFKNFEEKWKEIEVQIVRDLERGRFYTADVVLMKDFGFVSHERVIGWLRERLPDEAEIRMHKEADTGKITRLSVSFPDFVQS
jgi:hypothetical protein